ncbi:Membrane protein involved in the export of O-antigen and teichoic acid [Geodermatophilus pulveris]|uniref:Membrane protein involved in the export of O-antigen and teichoic acid n=1 Tax=Geodermatophilus pulveris TaxID=1564159 RepID=A0A239BS96_9ACTN|nr:hypothetical protein [Geodermatophilus pulveris]SNS10288.1 Membrane protein involved in the export of O-antigen and teichoic acid [Geodermatophilus pulveris]
MTPGRLRSSAARVWAVGFYRNSVLILATQAVTSAVGYLFWALSARDAGPAATGLGGSLLSAVSATHLVTSTGIVVGTLRLLAEATDARVRRAEAVRAGVATALLSVVGGLLLTTVVPRLVQSLAPAAEPSLAIALVVSVVATSTGLALDAVALAVGRTPIMLVRGAVMSTGRLLVFLLPGQTSLHDLIWSYALATVAADLLALALLRPRESLRHVPRALPEVWDRRRYFLGYHLTALGGAGAVYLLPVVVLTQLGPVQAGYFYPTWLLGGLFFTISPAVANAYLARSAAPGEPLHAQVRQAVVLIGALLSLPLLVVAVAPDLVLGALGPGYADRGRVLLWVLAVSALPDAVTNIAVAALRIRRRLAAAATLNASMSALTLLSAFPLLGLLGIPGAGVAWLVAQTAGALAVPLLLRRRARV